MRLFSYLLVYLLLVFSSFTSCRSTNSTSDFHEHLALDGCDSMVVHSVAEHTLNELYRKQMARDDSMVMDFIVYSPPDSSGRQFVHSKGRVHRKQKVRQSDQKLHNEKNAETADKTELNRQSGQRETADKKEDSKSAHAIYWKSGLSLLALIIVIIITIRKLWRHL